MKRFNEIDVKTAKPGVYYLVNTCDNSIIKIDFIKTYKKTITTDWDDHMVYNYVDYYNHFFHDASDCKVKDDMMWNCKYHLFKTLNDAKEFLLNYNNMINQKELDDLRSKIENRTKTLEKYLSECVEDKVRYM